MAIKADDPNVIHTPVTDEYSENLTEQMIDTYKQEIKQFTEMLKEKQKAKERFIKQWERDEKIWKMKLESPQKVEPQFVYEKNDEYWKLIQGVIEDQLYQETVLSNSKIKHFDTEIQSMQDQIDSNKEALNKVLSEVTQNE